MTTKAKAEENSQKINTEDSNKYLTEMKELPPENENVKDSRKEDKQETGGEAGNGRVDHVEKSKTSKTAEKSKKENPVLKAGRVRDLDALANVDGEENENKFKIPISSRDIILWVINIGSLLFLIVLLTQFPKKAQEIKRLREEKILNESNVTYELARIEESSEKAGTLESMFLDDSGVIDFVTDVEKLRNREGSVVKSIKFTSQESVKDKTGNYGIPAIIELSGDWASIRSAVIEIEKLPYLFRVVSVKSEPNEETGQTVLKYGGFLYVKDKLE